MSQDDDNTPPCVCCHRRATDQQEGMENEPKVSSLQLELACDL